MSRDDDRDQYANDCTYIAMTTVMNCADLAVESIRAEDPDLLSKKELDLCMMNGLDKVEREGLTVTGVMSLAAVCMIWLKDHYMSLGKERVAELMEEIDEAEALAELDTELSEEPSNNGSMLN
jgi:hypothetical protein